MCKDLTKNDPSCLESWISLMFSSHLFISLHSYIHTFCFDYETSPDPPLGHWLEEHLQRLIIWMWLYYHLDHINVLAINLCVCVMFVVLNTLGWSQISAGSNSLTAWSFIISGFQICVLWFSCCFIKAVQTWFNVAESLVWKCRDRLFVLKCFKHTWC